MAMDSCAAPVLSPRDFDAALFDLDGVVTRTARVHAAAWKQLFDAFLSERARRTGEPFAPFTLEDYRRYVDGRPRLEGIRCFLESRGLSVPEGSPEDDAQTETVHGLGRRKNEAFQEALRREGVEVYEAAVELLHRLRAAGLRTAVVTSSRNAQAVLHAAGLEALFDVRVDGEVAARQGLPGKPQPDTFLHAARLLGVPPERAVVLEDALAGVEAGRRGGFGYVLGVRRSGPEGALVAAGAHAETDDLSTVRVRDEEPLEEARPDGWRFTYEGLEPPKEGLREALCTLGNGYFATRGAAPEAEADETHYPGTYLAGGYNRLKTPLAGLEVESEDLVNLPNWLPLTFQLEGGDWFNPRAVELLEYRQVLDLERGLLLRTLRFEDRQGRRTRVEQRRFVHMGDKHLAGQELVLEAENWSGRVRVRSALDGRVVNAGVARYRQLASRHLRPLLAEEVATGLLLLEVETVQSRLEVAQAARTRLFIDGQPAQAQRGLTCEEGYVAHEFEVDLAQGQRLAVEKVVALFSSRDHAVSEAALEARHALELAPARFEDLVATHVLAWKHLWRRCDLELELSEPSDTQRVLRLHIFHLLQTASPHTIDLDVGVPARGWHGEAYRGHIFWDELFIFPFLTLRLPDLTRALLRYRYRRLRRAREAARAEGFRGALYPWQSGSNGREESQRLHLNPRSGRWLPDVTWLQRHINAAIAYNVWKYYQATADSEFLYFYGAEMLLELARFWASMATFDEALGRYEIKGVMGPDEFHTGYPDRDEPGLDNNAYTNLMAVWVLCKGLEVLRLLPGERREELCETLALGDEELRHWEDVSRRMRLVFHADGVLSQFEGYESLREFDWEAYRARYGDIQRLDRILEAEGDSPNRYKLSKQADVLMLFYLFSTEELGDLFERLGYPWQEALVHRTLEYYLRRVSHGSTLSGVVHSWVLARSDRPRSWTLFSQALRSDISDVQGGTTPEGIHLGAMAGTVDLMQRAYTGIEVRGDRLHFNPHLPAGLRRLRLSLRYRRHRVDVEVTQQRLVLSSRWRTPEPLDFLLQGEPQRLLPCETREYPLTPRPGPP